MTVVISCLLEENVRGLVCSTLGQSRNGFQFHHLKSQSSEEIDSSTTVQYRSRAEAVVLEMKPERDTVDTFIHRIQ